MTNELLYLGLENKLVRMKEYEQFLVAYRRWREREKLIGASKLETCLREYCRKVGFLEVYDHIVGYNRARKEFREYITKHQGNLTLRVEIFGPISKDTPWTERFGRLEILLFRFYMSFYKPTPNMKLKKAISSKKIEAFLEKEQLLDLKDIFRILIRVTNKDRFASLTLGKTASPTTKDSDPIRVTPEPPLEPPSFDQVRSAPAYKDTPVSKVYDEKVLGTPVSTKSAVYTGTAKTPLYLIASDDPLPDILVEEIKLKAKFYGILPTFIDPSLHKHFLDPARHTHFEGGVKTFLMIFICVPREFDKEIKDLLAMREYNRLDVTIFPSFSALIERSPIIETKNSKEPV